MADLIERKPLYEQAAKLEAQALDYVGRLIERDGEETSEEWRIWSAILTERTAFKHDVFDAPSAESGVIHCKDCAYYQGKNCLNIHSDPINCKRLESDYCSKAIRKEDADWR